jgi:ProQ/FINO family
VTEIKRKTLKLKSGVEVKSKRKIIRDAKKLEVFVKDEYPDLFGIIKPLSINTRSDLFKLHGERFSLEVINYFLKDYVSTEEYLQLIVDGGVECKRIKLDGGNAGRVGIINWLFSLKKLALMKKPLKKKKEGLKMMRLWQIEIKKHRANLKAKHLKEKETGKIKCVI